MSRLSVFACALALVAGTASAQTFTMYDCKISNRSSKNVPEQVLLFLETSSGFALVMDPFIAHYVGDPIEATVTANSAKRITVTWTLANIANKRGQTIVHDKTSLTVIKATLKASVSNSQGWGDVETGHGSCKVSTIPAG